MLNNRVNIIKVDTEGGHFQSPHVSLSKIQQQMYKLLGSITESYHNYDLICPAMLYFVMDSAGESPERYMLLINLIHCVVLQFNFKDTSHDNRFL
jgi:hypothetical protein